MRRIYITLAVLLIMMIGMAYLYFSNLRTETNANELSLNAATTNASIVFSFENDKSFYEILSGQDLLQNLLGKSKSAQLKNLKENFAENNEIASALKSQKVYVSIVPTDKNVDFLITTQLKENTDASKLLKNSKLKINKLDDFYQINFTDSTSCFVVIDKTLVLISSSQTPIQNYLAHKQKADLVFANYIKTNSSFNKNTLAAVFLNFSKAPQLLKNILNTNITGELSIFNKQLAYAALTYNYSADKLLFNGYTDINDNGNYYKLFSTVPEQKISINKILPEKTANYILFSINDYSQWYQTLNNWFATKKENDQINKEIETINQKYRVDLKQIFPKYFKDQFITFQLNTGEKLGAIALNNGEKLSQYLLDLSAEYATDIRILKEPKIPYYFFGEPFKKFERPFYTIIDNYLVMANNASSVQSFLSSYSNNNLLINNKDYINFRDQISSSATICFYVNNKNANDIFGRNLKPQYFKQYQSKDGLKNFDAFCYQLSGEKGKFLTNLLMNKKQDKIVVPDTLITNP